MNRLKKLNKGYITLFSIIILSVIGFSIAISLLILSIGNSKISLALEQSSQAKFLSNTCIEEALEQIRLSTTFSGTNSINIGNGICSYTVNILTGENRSIISTGSAGSIIRKVLVTIDQINPKINIADWQEVADF